MASKGRPSGSTSRYCLIKDKALLPYEIHVDESCLLYTSPSPRDRQKSRMPSSA